MADKIVFDIETKDSFDDVGGQENLRQLSLSVVALYSYNQDKYFCFNEFELAEAEKIFKTAGLLIGFSSKRFDVPILGKYFQSFSLAALPHYDILEEVEKSFGRRVGLNAIAEANVGMAKTSHGLEAIEMYRNGEIEKLKEYCIQDVKITKEIFDLIRKQGYLWIPQRNLPQMFKAGISYEEEKFEQTKLL
ncbi:MAG: ribonuclease H-like domain-containing protein [bacterium]|nr:ribonuclease H-like domain-containing protein [bacterium]